MQQEPNPFFYSVLSIIVTVSVCFLENDFGEHAYGIDTICISTDFSPSEAAIIKKNIGLWNFDQTHFVFDCTFNSVPIKKDKQPHLQKLTGLPANEGSSIGLTQYEPHKRILISDTLEPTWLPIIAAHEAGHLIYVDHVPSEKAPAIMNDFIRPDMVNKVKLTNIDLVEYCKVWKCECY